jgi:mycofactocin precursor
MMKQEENESKWENENQVREGVPDIIEEIEVEDLTVDGICGVY